jgi:hypothetical protein
VLGKPKAVVFVIVSGSIVIAIGRTAIVIIVVPAAAAQNTTKTHPIR